MRYHLDLESFASQELKKNPIYFKFPMSNNVYTTLASWLMYFQSTLKAIIRIKCQQ